QRDARRKRVLPRRRGHHLPHLFHLRARHRHAGRRLPLAGHRAQGARRGSPAVLDGVAQAARRVHAPVAHTATANDDGSGPGRAFAAARKEKCMRIAEKTIFITGANRGIGRALVTEALRRGAKRVYAGTRGAMGADDGRVTPVTLDVTSASHIQRAAADVANLDILVNNAGVAIYDDLSDADVLARHLAVNCVGWLNVTRAFLPHLRRSQGAIVNNLSLASIAPLPVVPAYSISKAAALNMTQSLRMLLAGQGVAVHAALLGPTDTEMTRGFDIPKAS